MAKKKKKKKRNSFVITHFYEKDTGSEQSLSTPKGYWKDTEYMFVRRDPRTVQKFFYRSLSFEYKQRQHYGDPGFPSKRKMDSEFAGMGITEPPYRLKENFLQFFQSEMDAYIRAAFHLDSDIEWRWPEHGERIYHRTSDGFVGVWLEHIRSGWNPRCHQFIKHLCKYEYDISIMQITPNGVKWMNWFLASCNQMDLLPTFKLFHQLFVLVHSNKDPLLELRFRAEECGYEIGDAKPVMQ